MIHLQIAEAGKQHTLKGNHSAALERYRQALRLALQQKETSPIFLYHYTECILDALEAAGEAKQALALTECALAEQQATTGDLVQRVQANLLERRVVLLFALGQEQAADTALAEALPLGGPILIALQSARRRRFTITSDWLAGMRRQHGRSVVNSQTLRHADAAVGERHFMKEISYDGSYR